MKFAIFGNTYQAKKSSHALRLFQLLRRQKAEICMCRDFYQFLTTELKMDIHADHSFDGNDFDADMVISIGGDGTFLKAARRVGRKGIPILGINTGRLGFLADISPEEMEETFDEIQAGRYSVWRNEACFNSSVTKNVFRILLMLSMKLQFLNGTVRQ